MREGSNTKYLREDNNAAKELCERKWHELAARVQQQEIVARGQQHKISARGQQCKLSMQVICARTVMQNSRTRTATRNNSVHVLVAKSVAEERARSNLLQEGRQEIIRYRRAAQEIIHCGGQHKKIVPAGKNDKQN